MSHEIRFVQRQHSAEKPQALELAKFCKRLGFILTDSDGERRLIAKQAEKNQLFIVDKPVDL